MNYRDTISQDMLMSRLFYNPDTGIFRWLPVSETDRFTRAWNARYAGTDVVGINHNGYVRVSINKVCYLAHRLAYLYMVGEHPVADVMHLDGDRANNRWSNLRASEPHITNVQPITAEYLRSRVTYDPLTGKFTWLPLPNIDCHAATWNARYAGTEAGCHRAGGYKCLTIDDVQYVAHRLAYLYMVGEHPAVEVDHKDTDRSNNRWENLRPASVPQNRQNSNLRSDNTSGHKGITWDHVNEKWKARVCAFGQCHHLGRFDLKEDAIAAYAKAAKELHGEFART